MSRDDYIRVVGAAYGRVAAKLKVFPTKYAPRVLNLKQLPEAVTRLELVRDDAMDELYRGDDVPDDDDDGDK
jgi:hypothetical protein